MLCQPRQDQAANLGPQKWDYCAPKINYADVRQRVGNAFAEKANEIANAIDVVQAMSKEASRYTRSLSIMISYCPQTI